MAENLTATRRGIQGSVPGHGATGVLCKVATVEVSAAAASSSTYSFGNIPRNARILGMSKLYFDDLASSGSPTIDLGLFAVNSNVTSDDDALNDGINVYSAAGSSAVIKDISNYGKRAWEFVSGQTSDPGGELTLKATLQDAAANDGGTMTLELYYTLD